MPGLTFEAARTPPRAHPNRMDVALFVGFVARRSGALPDEVRRGLREGGWVDGAWARPADQVEALLQLPVVIESWEAFDRLYAWDARRVGAASDAACATTLGAAVRSFFASGGRRALIVRAGDPWPYLESAAARDGGRAARLAALGLGGLPPFSPHEPSSWRGLQHVEGLAEASLLCLPDLPEIQAPAIADPLAPPEPLPPSPEIFVECSVDEPPLPSDDSLRQLAPPRLDADGFTRWAAAVAAVRDLLAARRRDVMFVAALPLADDTAAVGESNPIYAHRDLAAFLAAVPGIAAASSAFVQLATPWLRTRRSADLAGGLEPGDGTLAAAIAAKALAIGTFRSIAGTPLPDVIATVPAAAWGLADDSPAARLAQRTCLCAPQPGGVHAWQSDVTFARSSGWQAGGASRLMMAVIRAARRSGDTLLFETSGERLWARLRRVLEDTLEGFWRAGGLAGATPDEAYSVRCDRSTMSQADLDAGRLIVAISVWPASALERIQVVLDLGASDTAASLREVA